MKRVTPLKLAIVATGRHQKDIATELGMDPATLSRIVNGWHCETAIQEAIAAVIGKPVSELFPAHGAKESTTGPDANGTAQHFSEAA